MIGLSTVLKARFTAAASLLALSTFAVGDVQAQEFSPHAEDLALHRGDAPFAFPAPRHLAAAAPSPRVKRIVYGYYPYWVTAWDQLRWDLLTHIAFFAVEVASDGSFTARHGWPDANFSAGAHAHGVKVDVAFTLFSGTGIHTLCSSAENRARAIDAMITAMEDGGADGINIDFEGVQGQTRDAFTTFITELRAELTARGHAGAGIGIAGPAVDYSSSFDLAALEASIDVYFIMGYGYHWGGSSDPGPVGQLRVTEAWRPVISISMERTLADYARQVPASGRAKIVLGVPYYGYDWPAASDGMHAAARGTGSSRTYAVARRAIAGGYTRLFDLDSENAWYAYRDAAGWRQTWYDDEESLAAKYQLALEQDIGGVGMWALGYDEDYPELWDTLDAYFAQDPMPAAGTRTDPLVISEFPFSDHNDTRMAPSNYFDQYSCSPTLPEYGREWVYAFSICQPGKLEATVTDGMGVDIDLHLLSAPEESACIVRNDSAISQSLSPGTYYLVADTYVANQVAQPGEYQLNVAFTPDDPRPACMPGEVCRDGRCEPDGPPPPPLVLEPGEPVQEIGGEVKRARDPSVPVATGEIEPMAGGCSCSAAPWADAGGEAWAALFFVLGLAAARKARF